MCARTPVPAATPERSKVLAFPHPRLWAPGSATRAGRAGAVPRGGRCLEAEGFEEPMLLRFRPLPSSHRLHLPQPSAFPPLPSPPCLCPSTSVLPSSSRQALAHYEQRCGWKPCPQHSPKEATTHQSPAGFRPQYAPHGPRLVGRHEWPHRAHWVQSEAAKPQISPGFPSNVALLPSPFTLLHHTACCKPLLPGVAPGCAGRGAVSPGVGRAAGRGAGGARSRACGVGGIAHSSVLIFARFASWFLCARMGRSRSADLPGEERKGLIRIKHGKKELNVCSQPGPASQLPLGASLGPAASSRFPSCPPCQGTSRPRRALRFIWGGGHFKPTPTLLCWHCTALHCSLPAFLWEGANSPGPATAGGGGGG